MSQNTQAASGGIGFTSLLGLMFIAFKLLGVINWSWLWVLAPFWIPLALLGAFLTAMITIPFIVLGILYLITKFKTRKTT